MEAEHKTVIKEKIIELTKLEFINNPQINMNLDNVIELFFRVLEYKIDIEELDGLSPLLYDNMHRLSVEAQDLNSLRSIFQSLNKNEQYAKKLLYIVDPQKYKNISARKDPRLKGFSAILSELDKNISDKRKRRMTGIRNGEDHSCYDWTTIELYQKIARVLSNYLLLTYTQSERLNVLFGENVKVEEQIDYSAYVNYLLDEHRRVLEAGFKYFNFSWFDRDNNSGYDAESVVKQLDKEFVKILGEAGTGKSTILKQIEYIIAKKYKDGIATSVPIFIELGTITNIEQSVKSCIGDILDISEQKVEYMLNAGDVCLLLDGFNEISNSEVQKKISIDIDKLMNYGELTIVMTDRMDFTHVQVLSKARKLYLLKPTIEEMKAFFEENCNNPVVSELITNELSNRPELFENITTPLKMKNFIHIVEETGEIPTDYLTGFLNYLFKRERKDKKEDIAQVLPTLLKGVACKMVSTDCSEITELAILTTITKIIQTLGLNDINSLRCVNLAVELGILERKENMISFTTEEYKNIYFIEGMQEGIDEIV